MFSLKVVMIKELLMIENVMIMLQVMYLKFFLIVELFFGQELEEFVFLLVLLFMEFLFDINF